MAADCLEQLTEFKTTLSKHFKLTDCGELKYLLGIRITKENNSIYLSSELQIKDLLSFVNMENCSPASTPMAVGQKHKLSVQACPKPNSIEESQIKNIPYRETIGRLINLAVTSRPDIAQAVTVLSRYIHNPGKQHWYAAQRVIRYLKATSNLELKLEMKSNEMK